MAQVRRVLRRIAADIKILPWRANQVSVQPPLSQIRIGTTALIMRRGDSAGAAEGAPVRAIMLRVHYGSTLSACASSRSIGVSQAASRPARRPAADDATRALTWVWAQCHWTTSADVRPALCRPRRPAHCHRAWPARQAVRLSEHCRCRPKNPEWAYLALPHRPAQLVLARVPLLRRSSHQIRPHLPRLRLPARPAPPKAQPRPARRSLRPELPARPVLPTAQPRLA